MAKRKKTAAEEPDIAIGLDKKKDWSKDKLTALKYFISAQSAQQTKVSRLQNEMLSIKFQMESYVEKDLNQKQLLIGDFVNLFLNLLEMSKKEFADIIEMQDTNLYKYLKGERKLNSDLAMKFSVFFHTTPQLWYNIQVKNELQDLKKENVNKYKKYDYLKKLSLK